MELSLWPDVYHPARTSGVSRTRDCCAVDPQRDTDKRILNYLWVPSAPQGARTGPLGRASQPASPPRPPRSPQGPSPAVFRGQTRAPPRGFRPAGPAPAGTPGADAPGPVTPSPSRPGLRVPARRSASPAPSHGDRGKLGRPRSGNSRGRRTQTAPGGAPCRPPASARPCGALARRTPERASAGVPLSKRTDNYPKPPSSESNASYSPPTPTHTQELMDGPVFPCILTLGPEEMDGNQKLRATFCLDIFIMEGFSSQQNAGRHDAGESGWLVQLCCSGSKLSKLIQTGFSLLLTELLCLEKLPLNSTN
ncbi:basic proline-rich protein-like [Meriones unguiculatus]|uniref:basic proline-rich protein-like n=1 Tax=Meriones unguiculatus TaxID=10047 RepID=UPI00293F3409|nr:basic proline-rich protein-like [Meriones unguiculatus]